MKIFAKTGKFKDFNIKLPAKVMKALKKDGIKIEESNFVRKGLTVSDMKFIEGERASIDYISTIYKDRDNEILIPSGGDFSYYELSPVAIYGHDYSILPIGRTAWIKQDEIGLIAKTIYATEKANPMGDRVYNLKKEGILTSKSIGFAPVEVVENKDFKHLNKKELGIENIDLSSVERIYTKWILLEQSDVMIPSNFMSINLAVSKSMDDYLNNVCDGLDCDIKKEARHFFADMYDISDASIEETQNQKDIIINVTVNNTETETIEDTETEQTQEPEMPEDEEIDQKIEVTEDFIHVPVRNANLFLENSFRTIDISMEKGIKAIVGRLKENPGGGVTVQKYLFDKGMWTEGEAVQWTQNHAKSIYNEEINQKFVDIEGKEAENLEIKDIDIVDIEETPIEKPLKNNDFMKSICKDFTKDIKNEKDTNKTINKFLDITEIPSIPSDFNYEIYSKYLEVDVKDIFENNYKIPNVMVGSQLSGFKEVFSDFEMKDERNFNYNGTENPIQYKTIQLTSEKSEEFMIEGTRFYSSENGNIIANFYPAWSGLNVSLFTSKENSNLSKKILNDVDIWVEKNNYLKGQKFSISGEFLSKSEIGWDDLILTEKNKETIQRNIKRLSETSKSRGLMLVGSGGTGKTLTGKAINKETNSTFIWASSDDFKEIGAISGLSLAFKMARKLAPTVLFIEDIDNWMSGSTIDILKTEMDGMKSNDGIVTILTSNTPENFPDTLIDRPGRFHHILSFSNPDEVQRKEMLDRWAKGADEDKINEFVGLTEGLSGSHIKELIDYAKMLMEDEDITFGKALIDSLSNMREQKEFIESIRENRVRYLESIEEQKDIIDIENIKVAGKDIIDIENIEVEKKEKEEITKEDVEALVNKYLEKIKPIKQVEVKEEIDILKEIDLGISRLYGKIK